MMRHSLQDAFTEHVDPRACDHCGTITPAWALYESQGDEPEGYICGQCIADFAATITLPEPESTDPWETEWGKHLKAERNLLLSYDTTGWAIMPDSPVDDISQSGVLAFRALLNRMTVDFTPDTWIWPDRPKLEYRA